MRTILDYVKDTGWMLFPDKPLCAADSLVFSQLSYLNFSDSVHSAKLPGKGIRFRDAIMLSGIRPLSKGTLAPDKNEALLAAILESRRFSDIELRAYADEIDTVAEKQFSAITFCLPNGQGYVAFRGTDASIIGWKEDLNMAFTYPVPAQEEAVRYLEKVAGFIEGDIFIGGHSKGGNLAIYSAVKCGSKVRARISGVFNHDGPGFKEDIYSDADYLSIADRIHTSLPTHSVVGLLLQHDDNYKAVRSSTVGILQHDPFTWGIKDFDLHFTGGLNRQSLMLDKTVKSWLSEIDEEKRQRFVDSLFEIIDAANLGNLHAMRRNWRRAASASLEAIRETDDETRKFALEIAKLFAKAVGENLKDDLRERLERGRGLNRARRGRPSVSTALPETKEDHS